MKVIIALGILFALLGRSHSGFAPVGTTLVRQATTIAHSPAAFAYSQAQAIPYCILPSPSQYVVNPYLQDNRYIYVVPAGSPVHGAVPFAPGSGGAPAVEAPQGPVQSSPPAPGGALSDDSVTVEAAK